MSSSQLVTNSAPEIKGYRIRQYVRNEQDQANDQQTLLKVVIKNQSNGIPKIRNDVICNGKHYPFVPLFTFTSEDDLKILEQISTIVLKDQNEILCEILTGRTKEIRVGQFKDLKTRFKQCFSLDLKIDPEELFLILISDQITKQTEFNEIFDLISQTQFVNVLKKIYQNCPNRMIPKVLRKIAKYFNLTKGRTVNSIERLKRVFKSIKSAEQAPQFEQKQEDEIQLLPKNEQNKVQQWVEVPHSNKKTSNRKTNSYLEQKIAQVSQKPAKKLQENLPAQKKVPQISASSIQSQRITKKITEQEKVKKTEKVTKKQKIIKAEEQLVIKNKEQQKQSENEENWQDVDGSEDFENQGNLKSSHGNMIFHVDDSDEDLKYLGPKKKNKKNKTNINIHLDPEVELGLGKKSPHLKKQKKNNSHQNSNANLVNQDKQKKKQLQEQEEETFDRRNHNGKQNNRNKKGQNGKNNNEQSVQKGKREYSKENKKLDTRILLGINGASDAVWREKMRPPKYLNNQNYSFEKNTRESMKENRKWKESQSIKDQQRIRQNLREEPSKNQNQKIEATQQLSKNLSLQKIFSIPEDCKDGKQFKFEKRDYNLFVNKLFWVNISGNQVTVQKDGKGYIRKCPVEILDNGKAIMAEGLTIHTDDLSNLEDGGTAFGNPVFQEFTPDGQWFHIRSLDVFAYV